MADTMLISLQEVYRMKSCINAGTQYNVIPVRAAKLGSVTRQSNAVRFHCVHLQLQ
jgi:hypothetical protein